MAHTKAQKAASGNRDSKSKRLGVKLYEGQKALAGNILIRQKGTKVQAGDGTYISRDYTIISQKEGTVEFKKIRGKQYIFVR